MIKITSEQRLSVNNDHSKLLKVPTKGMKPKSVSETRPSHHVGAKLVTQQLLSKTKL